MNVRALSQRALRRATLLLAAGAAGAAAACNEDFITGPNDRSVTLELRGWADTVVLGDARTVRVRVLDSRGREITGVRTQLDVGAPSVLETRLNAAGASAASLAVTSASDSVAFAGARAGAATVVLTLLDPRFSTTEVRRTATVVVAGVRLATGHDTTLTALGDTSVLVARALARQGTGMAADYLPVAGQGVSWTRRGTGAVRLVGTGDSVRVVAEAAGTDTLVASHASCLAGGRCADTTIVRVAQSAAVALGTRTYRAWSLGDSVAPQVVLADARGNAVAGARFEIVPLTAADSALVAVNTTAGVPAFSRSTTPQASVAAAPSASRAPAEQPALRLVARASAAPSASAIPAEPTRTPPLVAKANGTARAVVRALGPGGVLLAHDTITVVVRQIAQTVHVAPAYADLTPGDSVPVAVAARDARGHLIADAAFQPAMSGAVFRNGRIVVPGTAAAGERATLALAVVGVAQPQTYQAAPIADPAPDSSRVRVRLPAPVAAGDTAASAASALTAALLTADGRPRVGVWVRFRVPAGSIVGPDSARTDASGVAHARWVLPTTAGVYTASAVEFGAIPDGGARADTAGQIVLRNTATVVAGAPAALALRVSPPASAAVGAPITPAPAAQVTDAYGNAVRQAGLTVTVSAPEGAALGFSLTGTLTATTDADGRASFPSVVGTGTPGRYALEFAGTTGGTSPAALAAFTTAPVDFTGAPAVALPPALDPARSTVTISAPSVASGAAATVTVTPRDASGAPMGAGQTVDVTVPASPAPGDATATVASAVDQGDGTYTVVLTGVRAGAAFPVTARANGVTLSSSPTLAVTPGAPAAGTSSLAVGATALAPGQTTPVTVHVADAAGNVVTGAVASDVVVGASIGTLGATTCAAGSCTATYTAGPAGTAAITADIGGAAVVGSPASVAVYAGITAVRAVPSTTLTVGGTYAPFNPVTIVGGTAPIAYALAGTLPDGVLFDAGTGAVSGTATARSAATTYTVTATDANGDAASETFTLQAYATPSAPTLDTVGAGDGTLTLSFTAPADDGGTPVTNYQYSLTAGASWVTRSPAATTSPLVVTGLTNGTTYPVAVRAVNGAGAGAASASLDGTPIGRPLAPTGLTAATTSTSVSLSWTPPAGDGGSAITDYVVQYGTGGSWTNAARAASTSPTQTVTGLASGTAYSFRVAAVNAVGAGATSAVVSATPGAAGPPTGLAATFNQTSATAQNASLSWSAPGSMGSGTLTDYVVEYKLASSTAWTTAARTASTTPTATLAGLAIATTYDFRVSAKTTAGTGSPSAVLRATTTGPSERLACTTPGTSNSSVNSISIAPCTGVQAGNLIVIPVTIGNSTGALEAITADAGSAGFTALGTTRNAVNQTTVFAKVATSDDVGRTAPYAFRWTNNVKAVVTLVTYKGVKGDSVTYQGATGTGASAVAPSVAVSNTRYSLAYFYTMTDVSMGSTTPNVGQWTVGTGIWKNTTAGANNANAAAVLTADVDKAAAGTSNTQSATTSGMSASTHWNAITLVLRPTP